MKKKLMEIEMFLDSIEKEQLVSYKSSKILGRNGLPGTGGPGGLPGVNNCGEVNCTQNCQYYNTQCGTPNVAVGCNGS